MIAHHKSVNCRLNGIESNFIKMKRQSKKQNKENKEKKTEPNTDKEFKLETRPT